MDLGFIFLAIALIGVVIFIVAQPFLEPQKTRPLATHAADELTNERESILNAVRDLDFDHATGKLTDEEHAAQRAQLMARGAEIFKQLDALGVTVEDEAGEDDEAAIERAIAARRKAAPVPPLADSAERVCPTCQAEAQPEDRFCSTCGSALPRVCAQCAAPLDDADRFCGKCGTPVAAEVEL